MHRHCQDALPARPMLRRLLDCRCCIGFAGLIVACCFATIARAQEPAPAAPTSPPSVTPPMGSVAPKPPVSASAADVVADAKALQEQSIYIPYGKLREVFEREGRGVYLPYDKFQELWRTARDAKQPPVKDKPPVAAVISEATHEAVVERDVVRVAAALQIEVLETGWQRVPLRLGDAAILAATISGQPARLVNDRQAGYFLLVERKQNEAGKLELKLEYAKAFAKEGGQNVVAFAAPLAPVSRWRVRIDQPDVKIELEPLLAATDTPTPAKTQSSEVQAFVGAADTVRIRWTPRAEGAAGLEVLACVEAQQQIAVDENVIRTRVRLRYTINRGELKKLEIQVPSGQRVVNLFDANVRRWTVADVAAQGEKPSHQKIDVDLFEPARSTQDIGIELEQLRAEEAASTASIPAIVSVGAARQQGTLVVGWADTLRVEPLRRSGLSQVDRDDLPADLRSATWRLAYRYAAIPYDLALSIETLKPRIVAETMVDAALTPESWTLDVQSVLNIDQAGVFRITYELPEGFEVRSVRGEAVAGATPVQVDTHRAADDNPRRITVQLRRKAQGRVGLLLQIVRRLKEPDLFAPTGKVVSLPLEMPRLVDEAVEQSSGRLIVSSPESLRVNFGATEGMRIIPPSEARQGVAVITNQQSSLLRVVQAFTFGERAASVAVLAERRKPHVSVRQLLVVRVEQGFVKYEARLTYDILYSGVKSLRIDLPTELADVVRNETAGVREQRLVAPANLAEGYTAWSLAGESEFVGNTELRLRWERPIEKFDVGSSVTVKVPRLDPRGTDLAWGQIVLIKAEAIDVQVEKVPVGLRPIDPQRELMAGASVSDAAGAFEFHDPWQLELKATRYALEEVKHTSIERGVVRAVVTRAGELAMQAVYRMRSAQQRVAIQLPANAHFDTEPLHINGSAVLMEKAGEGSYSAPLVGLSADQPFVLELQFTLPGGNRFDLPAFDEQAAAQKVFLFTYLPADQAVLASHGAWTDELRWTWMHAKGMVGAGWQPTPLHTDGELVNWVTSGVTLARNPFEVFQTDGRPFVFSTLRPAPAPEGSLTLTRFNRTTFNLLAAAGLIVLGVALLRRPMIVRVVTFGVLIAALMALALVAPMLICELVNESLIGIGLLVVVMWVVVDARSAWRRSAGPDVERATVVREVASAASDEPMAQSSEPSADVIPSGESPPNEPTSGEQRPDDSKEVDHE